jgi:hypothetical protein
VHDDYVVQTRLRNEVLERAEDAVARGLRVAEEGDAVGWEAELPSKHLGHQLHVVHAPAQLLVGTQVRVLVHACQHGPTAPGHCFSPP